MPTPLPASIDDVLAPWARTVGQSVLRDLIAASTEPDVLSFAIGMPAAEFFPHRDYADAAVRVLEGVPHALHYGVPPRALKAQIVRMMRERSLDAVEEQVFLTTGAQQAMSLIAKLLLEPGGRVILDSAVYDGLLLAVRPLQAELVTVPGSTEGMDMDALEVVLRTGPRPAFIYSIPDGHNPLGVTMTLERRIRLAELARRYRVPVVEDDAYGFLHYGPSTLPTVRSFAPDWVLYVGSFSKVLAPSLRVGWTIVPEALVPRLAIAKHGNDLDTHTLAQWCLLDFLESGAMAGHLTRIRDGYRARRDAMIGALDHHFPAEARWTTPDAGMFVWVRLPDGVDATEVLKEAIYTERVAFIPGAAFDCRAAGIATTCMRLCFATVAPEAIEEGIARLGRVVRKFCQQGERGAAASAAGEAPSA